jgi:acyl-CoA synthetase (AMP-forming)/AMP-acid ligase II
MTIISSRHQTVAPATNLLSYLFDSPYSDHEIWPADDQLFLSPPDSEYPSYTFEQVLHLTKCLSSGLQRLGAQGKRVVVYGDSNVHFQIALLGAIGAGAAVNPCPCSTVHDTVFRLQKIDADFVIFNSSDMDTVRLAAAEANFLEEQLFSIDHLIEGGKATGKVQHWSTLFDFGKGPVYQWPQLSSKESKETVAFYLYTSGYEKKIFH